MQVKSLDSLQQVCKKEQTKEVLGRIKHWTSESGIIIAIIIIIKKNKRYKSKPNETSQLWLKPCNSWWALHSQELLLSLFPPLPTATGAVVAAQLTAVVGRSHGSAALLEQRQGTFGLSETVSLGNGCQCNQDGSRCPAHSTPKGSLELQSPMLHLPRGQPSLGSTTSDPLHCHQNLEGCLWAVCFHEVPDTWVSNMVALG